ncbi:MAG: heme-binding protein [Vicinamibacterales bacterium]
MKTVVATLIVACAGIVPAHADDLTLDAARQAMAAATATAARLKAPGGAIAIVDAGGHLVMLERLDGSFPAGAAVSIEKARTAAVFRMPTRNLEDAVAKGRTSLVAVDVMLPLRGGVPLVRGGRVFGAVGVSGAASAAQDDEIAQAVADAFTAGPAPATAAMPAGMVVALASADVTAAFTAGRPLLENDHVKIHASRREAAGMAEVHTRDTDIVYVLDGAATLVTGGSVVDGRTTAMDEIRGASIDGGETRRLVKGDVVVVPNGVPHWFKQVDGPLLYYVVKVTAPAGSEMGGSR